MDLHELVLWSKGINVWSVGNDFLYKLFSENISHVDSSEIVAKVWILGRTYSASIERHKNRDFPPATNFYEDVVPYLFKGLNKSNYFDESIQLLRGLREDEIEDNLDDILTLHLKLQSAIQKFTKDKKTSFCSKYLHFHCPNCYFIYDSIARNNIKGLLHMLDLESHKRVLNTGDPAYSLFYGKCQEARKALELKYQTTITIREFDTVLMNFKRVSHQRNTV